MHITKSSSPCDIFCFLKKIHSPRVVVSAAALHARVWGSVPGLGGLKETKIFLPHPRVKVSIVGSLRAREVACSASDRQGPNFESCVWRTVSSHSSHHPQEVLLAQFSLYVHKGDLKPDSFHFSISLNLQVRVTYSVFLKKIHSVCLFLLIISRVALLVFYNVFDVFLHTYVRLHIHHTTRNFS